MGNLLEPLGSSGKWAKEKLRHVSVRGVGENPGANSSIIGMEGNVQWVWQADITAQMFLRTYSKLGREINMCYSYPFIPESSKLHRQ